jgi:hypothetical protein
MALLRPLLAFKLGAWIGMLAGAAFVRRAVRSQGDEESDELALVAVLDGIELKSRATAFRGGSMTAWFGGIVVDLREAELAADARLTVSTLFGGIEIGTPPGWRIESHVNVLGGGIDVRKGEGHDPDAPVLVVDGRALFGGVSIGPKAAAKRPSPAASV